MTKKLNKNEHKKLFFFFMIFQTFSYIFFLLQKYFHALLEVPVPVPFFVKT